MASLSELIALHEYKYGRNRGLQQRKDMESINASRSRTRQNDRQLDQADERIGISKRSADQTDTRIKQADRQLDQTDTRIGQEQEKFDFLKSKYEDSKETQKYDIATKILEINDKITKLKQDEEKWNIAKNILKAKGIIPMDETETQSARNVAVADADANSPENASGVKTESGKLANLINGVKLSGDIYDPKLTYEDNKPVDKMRVRTLATSMAKEAKSAELQKQVANGEIAFIDPKQMNSYQPTADEIQKFMPDAIAYLNGDATQTDTSLEPKEEQPISEIPVETSEYRVGAVYEDGDGRRAEYMGGGKWRMV